MENKIFGLHPEQLFKILSCILVIVGLTSAILYLLLDYNNDNRALLFQTEQMLFGKKHLYRDIEGIQLPVIFYIYVPAVLASIKLGVPIALAFHAYAICCGILCSFLVYKICYPQFQKETHFIVAACIFAIFTDAVLSRALGERDYFVFIFTLPYFFLIQREDGNYPPYLRALVAILAGMGFSIKPHFAIVWLLPNLYLLYKRRSITRSFLTFENIVVMGTALFLMMTVVIFFPDYFRIAMPLAMTGYGALADKPYGVLMEKISMLMNYAFIMVFALKGNRNASAAVFWIVIGLGYFCSILLNGPWRYTQYGFVASFNLVLCILVLDTAREKFFLYITLFYFALLVADACYSVPATFDIFYTAQKEAGSPPDLDTLFPVSAKKIDNYLSRYPHFILYSRLLWGTAFTPVGSPHVNESRGVWPYLRFQQEYVQGKLHFDALTPIQKSFFDQMVSELAKPETDMLLVEERPLHPKEMQFKILEFLKLYPPFTKELSHYHLAEQWNECVKPTDSFCAFEVYLHEKGKRD